MARLRVVLDTNVLVSGLAYPGSVPGRILAAWRQGGLEVVLSHYILNELVRVLPRLPRISMTPGEIRDLADSLLFLADVVEPEGVEEANLRDPADQPVLLTLLAAKADYLVTGDHEASASLALQGEVSEPAIIGAEGTPNLWRGSLRLQPEATHKDLLALADQYPILTPAEFWARHGG